jgi:hypothetical protein
MIAHSRIDEQTDLLLASEATASTKDDGTASRTTAAPFRRNRQRGVASRPSTVAVGDGGEQQQWREEELAAADEHHRHHHDEQQHQRHQHVDKEAHEHRAATSSAATVKGGGKKLQEMFVSIE